MEARKILSTVKARSKYEHLRLLNQHSTSVNKSIQRVHVDASLLLALPIDPLLAIERLPSRPPVAFEGIVSPKVSRYRFLWVADTDFIEWVVQHLPKLPESMLASEPMLASSEIADSI